MLTIFRYDTLVELKAKGKEVKMRELLNKMYAPSEIEDRA